MFVVRSRFLKAEGAWFDFEGYRTRHMPLLRRLHAKHGLLDVEITPGKAVDEFASVKYVFRDEAAFGSALNDMKTIRRSLARFTNACMDVKLEWGDEPASEPPRFRLGQPDIDLRTSDQAVA